jgi:hypothetical protein
LEDAPPLYPLFALAAHHNHLQNAPNAKQITRR